MESRAVRLGRAWEWTYKAEAIGRVTIDQDTKLDATMIKERIKGGGGWPSNNSVARLDGGRLLSNDKLRVRHDGARRDARLAQSGTIMSCFSPLSGRCRGLACGRTGATDGGRCHESSWRPAGTQPGSLSS